MIENTLKRCETGVRPSHDGCDMRTPAIAGPPRGGLRLLHSGHRAWSFSLETVFDMMQMARMRASHP